MANRIKLEEVTPLILTWNEAPNIERCINAITWARRIVVVDSYSSDETLDILKRFSNVKLVQRTFDNHWNQWNFGLGNVETKWVLTLDADYVCSPGISTEIEELVDEDVVFYGSFRYLVFGKPLRGTLYPPRAILFPKQKCKYIEDGHTQLLDSCGLNSQMMRSKIDHDDRKPLSRWIGTQSKYAELESSKLLGSSSLGWKDRIRLLLVFAPLLTFGYCLFAKGLVLNGWRGFFYTMQRVYAEILLTLNVLERKIGKDDR